MTIVRTITVEIHEDNNFTVREGDSYCPELCWDEMLGTIAELTHPRLGTARYRMMSTSQHARRQRKREAEERSRAQIEAAEKREAELRQLAEERAAERARDERMARLSEAAEAMLAALYAVRNSEAWKAIEARTRDEVLAAIAAAEGAPEQTAA